MSSIGRSLFIFVLLAAVVGVAIPRSAEAQSAASKRHTKKKPHGDISIEKRPTSTFHPTFNFDSGSVGHYFFPPNLGAKWTMRIIARYYSGESKLLKSDTSFSFEKVVNDSNHTLQGAPVIECLSSVPFHKGQEDSAKLVPTTYYLDDSVVMVVINHTLTGVDNRYLLVGPLKVGNHWHDITGDTVVTRIIAMNEPVTVPLGSFSNALVVRTMIQNAELSKYFVPGVGIVKSVYRGAPDNVRGTLVVTAELIALDRGDPAHNIRAQFQKLTYRTK